MKKNQRMNSNTKAKIALFSVLGVLAVANYQGQPQSHQSQGETEFASLGVSSGSKDLEKGEQYPLVKGSELHDEVNENNRSNSRLNRENTVMGALSPEDPTVLKASDKEDRENRETK